MTVAVTGAAGFLGRAVVQRLLAEGHPVRGIDREFAPPLPASVDSRTADVTDAAAMRTVLEGVETVVHAAAIADLWRRDPADFDRVNHRGTRTVLAASAAAGATRAVHVSSYVTLISGGRTSAERRVDETLELPPEAMLGPYPRSKRLAELAALEAPLPTAIVLPPAIVGPGDHRLTPGMKMLVDLGNRSLPAMLDCLWALADVRDVAEGVVAALRHGQAGRRYLLSGEVLDTAGFLACVPAPTPRARAPYPIALAAAHVQEAIAGITGKPPQASVTGVRLVGPRLRFDNARAMRELDYAPRPAAEAIRAAMRWLRDEGRIQKPLPELDETPGSGR